MSNQTERWWERVPRILGGWGFALLVFLRFPFPEAELVDGTAVLVDPGPLSWALYVGLIVFFVGIAHSTVTGIMLGSLVRAWSFWKRGGKERRDAETPIDGTVQIGAVLTPDRRKGKS